MQLGIKRWAILRLRLISFYESFPQKKTKIGIAILVDGSSSRMCGVSKQLLEFQGKTLLRLAAETALRAGFLAIVVLGAKHEIFGKEIEDLPLKIAVNEN